MDATKRPVGFVPEPDLQGIQPLVYEVDKEKRSNGPRPNHYTRRHRDRRGSRMDATGSTNGSDRYSDSRELSQNPQRSANRRSRAN